MTLKTIQTHLSGAKPYRTLLENRQHLVVPTIMIVEGVLNDALLLRQEFGKFVDSWNGRPVPVYHPQRNGIDVSAAQPDIQERTNIGTVYNARIDDDKLKSELWLDIDKAIANGFAILIEKLENGIVMEVSTGYFSDIEPAQGEFKGKTYSGIHRNIRPDHLALLPTEIGACSIADGCGAARTNKKEGTTMTDIKDAVSVIINALTGVKKDCTCNEEPKMDILKTAEKLKANKKLTAEQFEALSQMDGEQLAMVSVLSEALAASPVEPEVEMGDEEEPEAAMADGEEEPESNEDENDEVVSMKKSDIEQMVANAVKAQAEQDKAGRLVSSLVANQACDFTQEELQTMSVSALEKLEAQLRPTNYGAQVLTHGEQVSGDNVQALRPSKGLLANFKKEA